MQRIGIGMVLVGAGVWIVAGAVIFSSHSSGRLTSESAARGTAVETASASAAYDGSANSADSNAAWQGSYYIGEQALPQGAAFPDVVAQQQIPWYTQLFGGFGAMFQNIVPGQNIPVFGMMTSPSQDGISGTVYPPACVITINPNSVPYDGSATISWTSRNAGRVMLQGLGEVASSGSLPVDHLTSTRAFALAVQGVGGTSSCYTVVDVGTLVTGPATCLISSDPTIITQGGSANLSWGSENTVSATLSGTGHVATVGGTTVSPRKTTTYMLTAVMAGGGSVSCSTVVTVHERS